MLRKTTSSYSSSRGDGLFLWSIGILLLAAFAMACWIGSFYVFGHPENSISYNLLRKLDKLDSPRRFELTGAPRGEFLDANKVFARYGSMAPRALEEQNDLLLRSYLRNYHQSKELVPYIIGPFNIMGAFRLGPQNFFPSGVVALARSTENPAVLLELVFPAAEENVPNLERMLLTGLDLTLVKTLDLTAVIDVRNMPDGRIIVTAIPLLYGSYTSSDATGTFSLEPPANLTVSAGLPVLNEAAVEEAEKHYQSYLERAELKGAPSPSLMRVQRTEAVGGTTPVARAELVKPEPNTTSLDGIPVARAVPVAGLDGIPVARAQPVKPVSDPMATPTPTAALQPFPAATTPASIATTAARQWSVYEPGRMPRGRLVDLDAARGLAGSSVEQGLTYLAGDFQVSASGADRAVLRGARGQQNIRVIVDFPTGSTPPPQGGNVSRDAQRPFQVTSVEQGTDGLINVYVREVTRP